MRQRLIERLRGVVQRSLPTRESLAGNRWLRWLGPSLLHPRLWHVSRRGIALGVAIGAFFSIITPVAQIPLSAAVAVLCRANVPAAVAGTLLNTPATFGPVYYGAWKTGSWLLGRSTDAPAQAAPAAASSDASSAPAKGAWIERARSGVGKVGKPLLLGAAVFAVMLAAASYGLVSASWWLRVRLKRRRRLRSRASPAGG